MFSRIALGLLAVSKMSVITSGASITINDDGPIAPTEPVVIDHSLNNSYLRVGDPSSVKERLRGETFFTKQEFILGSITLQVATVPVGSVPGTVPTAGDQSWRLQIFTDIPAIPPAPVGTSVFSLGTELFNGTGFFPANIDPGDFFTMNLCNPVSLSAATEYAFVVSWETDIGHNIYMAYQAGYPDGVLLALSSTSNGWTASEPHDMTFFLVAAPEPGTFTWQALGRG